MSNESDSTIESSKPVDDGVADRVPEFARSAPDRQAVSADESTDGTGGPDDSTEAAGRAGDPVGVGTPKKRKDKKKKRKKKKETVGPGRGTETMFRTSYRTHLDLSSLADTKANIMISINGLMITVLVGTVPGDIAANQMLLLPVTVLMLGCLGSLVIAVLAALPRITRRSVTLDDIRENRANILFFGTFMNMSEDDFLAGMWELMNDPRRTYTNMMRDLYGLGAVLEKKYRLVRTSFTVFMVGLILGVLLFLAVFAMAGRDVVSF